VSNVVDSELALPDVGQGGRSEDGGLEVVASRR
jgi:hypothetical protein